MKIFRVLLFISIFIQAAWTLAFTQENQDFRFTINRELPHTSVKNQARTQTCWSFSGLSFFESEMLRQGKPEVDLSEMFIVNHCYRNKADKFVRMKGNTNFGSGGIFYDILDVTKKYGLVPEQTYQGIKYDKDKHDHVEMDTLLRKMVEKVIKKQNAPVSSSWRDSLQKIVDSYLGDLPSSFDYQGKTYTPKTFVSNFCDINPDDYIQITSFSHHPFYQPFILEVPDNWNWSNFYNVPLDELEQIVDNSLQKGYTVAWAADVTETGFKKGVAIIPEENTAASVFPPKEKEITQQIRQTAFDLQETTDDHGMHIIGSSKDQYGKDYYIVKNSWGDYNAYKGYFYTSKSYLRYKTTSIMVNKNAIPPDIRKKLGFID